jgi:nitrous oxidase accessory protein NosD
MRQKENVAFPSFAAVRGLCRVLAVAALIGWMSQAAGTSAVSETPSRPTRTLTVALDGSGQYRSIQQAVDEAADGDTIAITPGDYYEDVTIHSRERLRLAGAGMDRVTIHGRNRVGSVHIGKWPYGASDVEVSGLTIEQNGGLALGVFNGRGVTFREIRVNGPVFVQRVEDARIERSIIGGSETTGVSLADSGAILIDNFIHDNDHGVTVSGGSAVRLEQNVITRNLFEAVVVMDKARAVLIRNTIVKNGAGIAFQGTSVGEVTGNIVSLNRLGFLVDPASRVRFAYNALHNAEADYVRPGPTLVPAPDLKAESDVVGDPRFVNPDRDDFHLRPDTPLLERGGFSYLGALAPHR